MPLPNDRNAQKPLEQKLQEVNRAYNEKEAIEAAKKLGVSYVDVAKLPINVDLLYLLSEQECRDGKLIPFFRVGKKLRVALVDFDYPRTKELLEKLKAQGYALNLNIASEASILEAIKAYQVEFFKQKKVTENIYDEQDLGNMLQEIQNLAALKDRIANYSGEESVNALLVGAMRAGASDIHIEPYENTTKVRFRIDGVLQDVFSVMSTQALQMVNQFKHMAHVKLNINNRPQDGRFSFYVNHEKVDVRLSSLPTMFGETLVMRLLANKPQALELTDLGLTGNALRLVQAAINRPNGLILATGPTGSGKTTTLYALLHLINTPEKKIITLEDPVEYYVDGLVQSQINLELEYDFAAGLRAILRQDPNAIMVGEIRDHETAEIACQASLTGHIVLSTLHTNDAVGTIPRLINMGLAPFVLAPALDTVVAQRLVRRICNFCREAITYSAEELKLLEDLIKDIEKVQGIVIDRPEQFVHGKGCEKCSYTGFHGQLGIFEIFTVDTPIEKMILETKLSGDIFNYIRTTQKMLTLREDGALRVIQGITTLSEILRVTSDLEK
ncbi:MAG: type II/IV secretion system protein [Candidatus Abawacabacteria bacterium]|nr:type II/IV secretion system protein [Candidatus Abawacabacteria bacterium]